MSEVRWAAAVLGALAAEAAQVAAAFAWVAFYSHVIDPGQPLERYQDHAVTSGPWVSIVAGLPIFYLAARWIARGVATAVALFVVFLMIDGTLLVAAGGFGESWEVVGLVVASWATKLLACHLGGRHAVTPHRDPA